MLRRVINKVLTPVGLKLIPKHHDLLYYQHDYGAGAFAKYRDAQIAANQRKLDWVWADDETLEIIAADIEQRGLKDGICHGARNGYEVKWFKERLGSRVIGTDLSDTATQFPDMVVHDFHEQNPEWIGKWDFVYSNSLDQAFDPRKALEAWVEQLSAKGCIYIEHTKQHGPEGASEMDPFGAHPMAMPYLLFEWGKGKYELADILHLDDIARKGHVWVFVVRKTA